MKLSVEAVELYEIAQRTDRPEHLTIFENPLCKTMFLARTRCFSDYVESVRDPLTQREANRIIDTLSEITDEEERVEFFFDEMRRLKPFPSSQRETVEYQYGSQDDFMKGVISSYVEPYLEARPAAKFKQLYQELRYEIASEIEEKDFCCTRRYPLLMAEIKKYIEEATLTKKHVLSEEVSLFSLYKRKKTRDCPVQASEDSSMLSNS